MNRMQTNDVDAVMSGFFKSQMPNPWPKAKIDPATASSLQPKAGGTLTHARMVLAASVMFLVFGVWGLSGSFKSDAGNGVEETHHIANKPGPNGVQTPKTLKQLPK